MLWLIVQGSVLAEDPFWMATYPCEQQFISPNLIATGRAFGSVVDAAASGRGLPSRESGISASRALGSQSAMTKSPSLGLPESQLRMPAWWDQPLQPQNAQGNSTGPKLRSYHGKRALWYAAFLEVFGIGVAAIGTTMLSDQGIDNYADTDVSTSLRNHVALNIIDAVADSSLVIAGTTWFQGPWIKRKLARASRVALAGAATTVEAFILKYAIGRARPGGPNTNSTQYHPFSSRYAIFSTSFLSNNNGPATASVPSGHAIIAFVVITLYAQNSHLPYLYVLPILVGVSRLVAVDGHWASDVVAGGFIGWPTADLTNRLFPNSNYGPRIFRDGVEFHGSF